MSFKRHPASKIPHMRRSGSAGGAAPGAASGASVPGANPAVKPGVTPQVADNTNTPSSGPINVDPGSDTDMSTDA